MKLKGIQGFVFNTMAGKLIADGNGIIETNDTEAINALKLMGFAEVKEQKKETKPVTKTAKRATKNEHNVR